MAAEKFTPITRKVNTIIVLTLIIGIGTIIGLSYWYISSTTNTLNNKSLNQEAEYLYQTIRTIMIPGQASLAQGYFENIASIGENKITIFRQTGKKAFSDNTTIESVNRRWGFEKFHPVANRQDDGEKPLDRYFSQALQPNPAGKPLSFRVIKNNRVYVDIYKMLENTIKCRPCHGELPTARGVAAIEKDITSELSYQYRTLGFSIIIFVFVVLSLAVILSQFMKNAVIKPVKVIGDVCMEVTNGNFESKVAIKNRDEIGTLGQTVNKMVEGLHERFKLSKYVSSSTIDSLKTEKKGERLPLTILFSDIRSFTSYAENKQPEAVVESLNKILNFQSEIIHRNKGDIDKYVGDEVVAFFSNDNPELSACRSALQIQRELAGDSNTKYGNLQVGIGINQGEVILGMVGSERRADYTIIGDNVNTASRLCDVAKAGQIIIADSIYRKVKEQVATEGPYKVKVKGKNLFLRVYILKGLKGKAK
ncbi:MAG: adenylate/guanylate cyclase domain-containing protein [Spirochaetia bacterium]